MKRLACIVDELHEPYEAGYPNNILLFRITNKVVTIYINSFSVTVTPDSDPESILFNNKS